MYIPVLLSSAMCNLLTFFQNYQPKYTDAALPFTVKLQVVMVPVMYYVVSRVTTPCIFISILRKLCHLCFPGVHMYPFI